MVFWPEKCRNFAFQIQVTVPKMLNYDLFGKDCHVSMKMSPDYIHKDFSKSSGSLNQALVNKLQREEVGKIRFRHWEVEAKGRGLGIDLAVF